MKHCKLSDAKGNFNHQIIDDHIENKKHFHNKIKSGKASVELKNNCIIMEGKEIIYGEHMAGSDDKLMFLKELQINPKLFNWGIGKGLIISINEHGFFCKEGISVSDIYKEISSMRETISTLKEEIRDLKKQK